MDFRWILMSVCAVVVLHHGVTAEKEVDANMLGKVIADAIRKAQMDQEKNAADNYIGTSEDAAEVDDARKNKRDNAIVEVKEDEDGDEDGDEADKIDVETLIKNLKLSPDGTKLVATLKSLGMKPAKNGFNDQAMYRSKRRWCIRICIRWFCYRRCW